MPDYNWSHLTTVQLGRYAEYYAKMEFTSYGLVVFSSEIDDIGIDFVVRSPSKRYYEIQVKSIRDTTGYIFAQKDKFDAYQDNLYMAVVVFKDGYHPKMYLIPATEWQKPNDLLRDRDYEGLKSKPEWGINISAKNMPVLEQYAFALQIGKFV